MPGLLHRMLERRRWRASWGCFVTAPRIVEEQAWQEEAACKGMPDGDAVFFPTPVQGKNSRYAYAAARLVCNPCPVRRECLAYALAEPEYFGMWGGRTPQERQRLRGFK